MGCGASKSHENEDSEELQLTETETSQQSASQSINSQIELKPMIQGQKLLFPDQKDSPMNLQIKNLCFFEPISNDHSYNREDTIENLLNELDSYGDSKKRHRTLPKKKSRRINMKQLEQMF